MFAKRLTKDSVGSVFCVLCAIGAFIPQSAQAGFDWTPPPRAAAPAPTQNAAPTPAGPLTPELDSAPSLPAPVQPAQQPTQQPVQAPEPLVLDNAPQAPQPAPVAERMEEPASPASETAAAPTPTAAPMSAPSPMPSSMPTRSDMASTPSAPSAQTETVIDGFGKDIPLAIALRDIVPSQYAYSFTPREIAGTKISWRGGKSWQDVLKSALAPHGYEMSVTENQIFIFSPQASQSATPSEAAPMQQPPAVSAVDPAPHAAALAAPEPLPAAIKSAPSKPPVMSAMDLEAVRKWQARPGTTLRQTLETWTKEINVELNWSTPYDYPINNAFYFDGKFTQALESLLSSYGGENPSPKGKLYPNLPEGPSVLMIN